MGFFSYCDPIEVYEIRTYGLVITVTADQDDFLNDEKNNRL